MKVDNFSSLARESVTGRRCVGWHVACLWSVVGTYWFLFHREDLCFLGFNMETMVRLTLRGCHED